ncbi:MAG: hypothetical protein OJF60_000424 [Burkholderiaceae bacterium]|jgi:quercetin dioxygenase-like cupin family protein|nr:MAG: hypothetical protein OJF60_000424 [Burkholderiaceae bacterium]
MIDVGATTHCEDLPWLPLAPKIGIRVLRLNPDTGGYTVMLRAEPGGVLPRHRHLGEAEIYIIKGSGTHLQTGDYRPGDFITERNGAVHDPLEFREETVLLMVAHGPSAFLAPDGSDMYFMDVPMLQGLMQRGAAHASAH